MVILQQGPDAPQETFHGRQNKKVAAGIRTLESVVRNGDEVGHQVGREVVDDEVPEFQVVLVVGVARGLEKNPTERVSNHGLHRVETNQI